jgi:hypothetical protein
VRYKDGLERAAADPAAKLPSCQAAKLLPHACNWMLHGDPNYRDLPLLLSTRRSERNRSTQNVFVISISIDVKSWKETEVENWMAPDPRQT